MAKVMVRCAGCSMGCKETGEKRERLEAGGVRTFLAKKWGARRFTGGNIWPARFFTVFSDQHG